MPNGKYSYIEREIGNIILGDSSLGVAAKLTQLRIEATGSIRHLIQRPIEEGWNNLLEKNVISQGLERTFSLSTEWKHMKIVRQKL